MNYNKKEEFKGYDELLSESNVDQILKIKLAEYKHLKEKNDKIRNSFEEFKRNRKYSELEFKIIEMNVFGITYHKDFEYEKSLEKDINAIGILIYKNDEKVREKITQKNGENFIDKDAILSSINISDVIGNYTNIKSEKRNIKCLFHEDRSPSMKIYSKTNSFHCFSCGRSGNVIGFIQQIEGLSFYEALKFLQNNY